MKNLRTASLIAIALALTSTAGCSVANAVHEESPSFNCYTDGNRLCGPTDDTSRDGWRVWQEQDGPRQLRVDPSKAFRVDFVGTATQYPEMRPYDLALVGKDGKWYVFRASYTS